MRYVKSVKRAAFMMKAQVFRYQDQVGSIVAEEYARAAFRFFVATLPIATGLLQHSATVSLIGGGRIDAKVLQDSRGNSRPVTEWSGDNWRTRIAYTMPAAPHLVTVSLFVKRSAFDLKSTGLSATGGRFGLAFKCGRKFFDEPEFVAFLNRKNAARAARGEATKEYANLDVSRVHAVDIIANNASMSGILNQFMDEARHRINTVRLPRLKQ